MNLINKTCQNRLERKPTKKIQKFESFRSNKNKKQSSLQLIIEEKNVTILIKDTVRRAMTVLIGTILYLILLEYLFNLLRKFVNSFYLELARSKHASTLITHIFIPVGSFTLKTHVNLVTLADSLTMPFLLAL
jgi:multisubunit Na+/H+ antiporter MnhB subunit